jgi:hypothetical protein
MPNPTLAESSVSHAINAPIERVDIADWLLHLPNAEYQRCCPPAHIACGATTTNDGQPMSGETGVGASLGWWPPDGPFTTGAASRGTMFYNARPRFPGTSVSTPSRIRTGDFLRERQAS